MSKATDIIGELDRWLALQVINHDVRTREERDELRRELQKYVDDLEQIRPVTSIFDIEDGVTVGTGGQPGKYTREMSERAASKPIVIHILDQSGQPYGSERRCCNRCGTMLWREMQAQLGTPMPIYTESWDEWNAAPNNCVKVKS